MLRSTTKSRKAFVTGAKAAEMACKMQTRCCYMYAFLILPHDRKHRQTYPQNPPHVFELVKDANHTQNAQQT